MSVFRFNHNGVDLNRNFPDVFSDPQRQQQSEGQREAEVGHVTVHALLLLKTIIGVAGRGGRHGGAGCRLSVSLLDSAGESCDGLAEERDLRSFCEPSRRSFGGELRL